MKTNDYMTFLRSYPEALASHERFRACLGDCFPEEKGFIRLLTDTFAMGIVNELKNNELDNMLVNRIVMRLKDDYFYDDTRAREVTMMWIDAYGVGVLGKRSTVSPAVNSINSPLPVQVPAVKTPRPFSPSNQASGRIQWMNGNQIRITPPLKTKKLTGTRFITLLKLMGMMFIQNMIFPVWFNTVVPYVKMLPGGESWVPFCGLLMGIGMFASPVVCMFADRFLDSRTVLALCNLVAAALLVAASFTGSPMVLTALLLGVTVCLMPTWSVASAIAMTHAPTSDFPYIRACGSIGWACSAVFSVVAIKGFGYVAFDKSPLIFASAACVAVLGAVLALMMPSTPPKAKDAPMSVADALGLKAFTLLKDRSFCLLSAILLFAMIPFIWYMGYNTLYLDEAGFKYLNLTQNIGQFAELGFMLLLPLLFTKLGFKRTMLVGLAVLALRYVFFYAATRTGIHALDFGGILVHGLIFGVLVVGFQMHAAEIAPLELRNQAQGFVMLLTAGVGSFLSVGVFEAILTRNVLTNGTHDWSVPYMTAFILSVISFLLLALFYRPRPATEGAAK